MSDEAPRSITEFDYFHSVIEFTKICSEKCGVLKGKDDKLDNTEITCLKQCVNNAKGVKNILQNTYKPR